MEDNNKEVAITVQPDEVDGVSMSMRKSISSLQEAEITVSPNETDGSSTSSRKSVSSAGSDSNLDKCCIYKVPEYVLKQKEDFYQPHVISIGPVFYKQKKLEPMQELKQIYLKSFLQHPKNENRGLDSYIDVVRKMKDDIRDCYQDLTMLSSCEGEDDDDEFIKMIVLDAAFLLCLFMTGYNPIKELCYEDDPRVPRKLQQSLRFIESDLLMLENQLPFFVLEAMFEVAFPSQPTSLIDLVRPKVDEFNIPGGEFVGATKIPNTSVIAHLLDLHRTCCCLYLSDDGPSYDKEPMQFPGTAKQLSAAGVKFKKSQNLNLLCVEFNNDTGELFIPCILVNKKTEAFLRNLLHFEQCHYYDDHHPYFGDLIYFLDSLIDTAQDIQILQQSGIIVNVLGSDEMAATLFNSLTANIMTEVFCNHYSDVGKQVKAYANKPWNQWMAILRRDYFGHPWAIISFVVAVIFLVLTVIQTISNFTEN